VLGTPYGYARQRGGALIQDFRPTKEDAAKQVGTASGALAWHTEDAHAELNPDFIALLCMRGDPQAKTLVSRVHPDELDPGTREALSRSDYIMTADTSYTDHEQLRGSFPVLTGSPELPIVRFDPLYTTCRQVDGEAALMRLREHIDAHAVSVLLEGGDLLFIDNRCAVHARAAFEPRYDESDRWLRRVSVLRRPVPAKALKGPHVIR
jgi:L-asparagine oxygenase